jgi:hypothetical protein
MGAAGNAGLAGVSGAYPGVECVLSALEPVRAALQLHQLVSVLALCLGSLGFARFVQGIHGELCAALGAAPRFSHVESLKGGAAVLALGFAGLDGERGLVRCLADQGGALDGGGAFEPPAADIPRCASAPATQPRHARRPSWLAPRSAAGMVGQQTARGGAPGRARAAAGARCFARSCSCCGSSRPAPEVLHRSRHQLSRPDVVGRLVGGIAGHG